MPKPRLTLKLILEELDVPREEWGSLEDCLLDGLERYAHVVAPGREEYVDVSMARFLRTPHLIGYGAVEVVRHSAVSLQTRLKFVQYVLSHGRPLEDDGIPHGVPAMLSFLAAQRLLEVPAFESLMQIADIEDRLFDDWTAREVLVLLDWLIAQADIPDEERLWWLWYIVAHCERADDGRQFADTILRHPATPPTLKRDLCAAWLEGRAPGRPPARWRAVKASLHGDDEAARAALAELDPLELEALEELESGEDGDMDLEHFEPSLAIVRSMFRDDYVRVPGYLKGHAVNALADLVEDPLNVCLTYLDGGYDADMINRGVIAAVRRHRARISDEGLRDLIDRALSIGKVSTRKAFYQLGIECFGHEYLERAASDNANSIRTWAAEGAPREEQVTKERRGGGRRRAGG